MFFRKKINDVQIKEAKFTEDWFSGKEGNWLEVLQPFADKPNIHYLEIGVFEGRSLIWMFQNVLTGNKAKATGVDYFHFAPKEQVEANISLSGFEGRAKLLKGPSQLLLRDLPINSFDIIYLDGDHRGRGAMMDLTLSWELLKEGGVLIFDDYTLHSDVNPPEASVKFAADAFVTLFQSEMEVVKKNDWQIFMKKVPIYTYNYITQAGPYFFDWGTSPSERHLMNGQTHQKVPLSEAELQILAEGLLARPMGATKVSLNGVEPEVAESLKTKAPDFFV